MGEVFEVSGAQRPPEPKLPGVVVQRTDEDALIDALLADLFIHANNCVRAFGDFHFACSAEASIEPALRRLMYDLSYRDFPWARTRLWMVYERDTVVEQERGEQYPALRDLLVYQSGIPVEQVHRMDLEQEAAEESYSALLREHLGWREKGHDRLDFVLVGIDARGSIGVAEHEAHEGDLVVRKGERMSLSLRIINASRVTAVYAAGEESAEGIRKVRDGASRSSAQASRLSPRTSELRWYVTDAGAKRIAEERIAE
jgi:6-phosphogluconolactonase/glucosamine-6-phosphate isomerase/deaminase